MLVSLVICHSHRVLSNQGVEKLVDDFHYFIYLAQGIRCLFINMWIVWSSRCEWVKTLISSRLWVQGPPKSIWKVDEGFEDMCYSYQDWTEEYRTQIVLLQETDMREEHGGERRFRFGYATMRKRRTPIRGL